MRAFLSWASSVVFVLLLVGGLYLLAHKRIAGFPDEPEKNVTLVPFAAPLGDVALVLEPPMATRQFRGQSQDLALQFTNKSKRRVELIPLRIQPNECIALEPLPSPTPVLNPRETVLQIYRSTDLPASVPEKRWMSPGDTRPLYLRLEGRFRLDQSIKRRETT